MTEGQNSGGANAAQVPNSRLALNAASAWLFPGLGHYMLGRRRRALMFAGVIFITLIVGCVLEGNLHRILPNQPLTILATLGSMGVGAPYFALRYLLGYSGNVVAAGYEYGSAFILTAGLMNLLLILDCLDIARGRKS